MRDRVNRMIAKETGQTFEKVVKDTERNFWMGAEEAVEYGLVVADHQRHLRGLMPVAARRWWRGAVALSRLCPQLLRRQRRRAGRFRRA